MATQKEEGSLGVWQKLLRTREKGLEAEVVLRGRGGTVRRGQGAASLGLFVESLRHSSPSGVCREQWTMRLLQRRPR